MHTYTVSGPAYPTHDTPFPDGWYINDTTSIAFLSDSHDHLNHLVGHGSNRVERVFDRTNPVEDEKSVTFIKHDNTYWVTDSWEHDRLHGFDDSYFVYDNEFIFQPIHGIVRTGQLEEFTVNTSTEDKIALKKFGRVDEILIVTRETLAHDINNGEIERLQPANRWNQP